MNDNLAKIFNDSTKVPITVGVASFVIGVGVGFGVNYFMSKRNGVLPKGYEIEALAYDHEQVIEKLASRRQEIKEAGKEVDQTEPEDANLKDLARDFVQDRLKEPMEIVPQPEPEEESPVERSIFAGTDNEWDYDKELASRTPAEPYIIHKDEFYANEMGYSQLTLTYYAGDDILVDDDDTPIYNHNTTVGQLKFGHGSGDPNVVHVRNDKRKAEYEIIKDTGFYSREVLGLDIEDNARAKDLRHSHHVPRFYADQ